MQPRPDLAFNKKLNNMEQIYGLCVECERESPLDNNGKCSVCGTKNK
jgi:hypothetical protein